ncbi:hypothetical protein [[Kitasatospora] papulosa]|uniref:hypothetical protein n=1 Tax=[Kitasatospora] papulosa TaxID=1464011 RepID=UPI0004BE2CAF|nr:hypothetical protein [[Kitasatospora] papulosa]
MYRIIRAATVQAQQADLAAAQIEMATMRGELEALRATADRAVATAIRAEDTSEAAWRQLAAAASDAGRADGELSFLRAQHLLDTEDRAVLRMLLRITRKQTRVTDRVYVLFQHGALHSIHSTTESAESAAEAEGAPRDGWTSNKPGAPLPPASEVTWRIQPLPVGGAPSGTSPN